MSWDAWILGFVAGCGVSVPLMMWSFGEHMRRQTELRYQLWGMVLDLARQVDERS